MKDDFYYQFAWGLLTKAELLTNNEEDDDQYASRLAQELAKHMSLRVAQELSATALEEYVQKVVAKESSDQLYAYLQKEIADFDSKREKWLTDFSYNFLERTLRAKQSL